jgi:uncharacterized DUF497 family protein
MEIEFTWDPEKAGRNLAKHGVSFAEGRDVFFDPHLIIVRTARLTAKRAITRLVTAGPRSC